MERGNTLRVWSLCGILMLWRIGNVLSAYSSAKETEIRNETVYSGSYDALSRPDSQTVIRVGLSVLAIDSLSLKDQKFSATGWFTFEWDDHRLTWNKTAKDDIEYIFAKPVSVWVPELVVDNSLVSLGLVEDEDILLRIKYDGAVDWEIPRLFEVHCEADIEFYPYDAQKCSIEIVSWGYRYDEVKLGHIFEEINLEDFHEHPTDEYNAVYKTGGRLMQEADIVYYPYDRQRCSIELMSWVYRLDELKLEHLYSEIDLEDFQLNGEWSVVRTYLEDKNLTETVHGVTYYYPQLDFWFSLRRRTDFYNLNVMMPVFLTSILIVLVFIVPVESGEKLSYVLTVYLSLAVLMSIINGSLPSTSISTSILGVYLAIVLTLSAVGILCCVVILILFNFDGKLDPTGKVMAFLRFAAKITCQKLPRETEVTCMTKVQPVNPDDHVGDDVNDTKPVKSTVYVYLTSREAAIILDWFCFVMFGVLTLTMNVSFVILLTVGGSMSGDH